MKVKNVTIGQTGLISVDKRYAEHLLRLGLSHHLPLAQLAMFKITDPTTLGENPRKLPGVTSFVACNQQGRILYLKGADNSNLASLTSNLINFGVKLGEAVSISGFESMVISTGKNEAIFIRGKDQNSGLIYTANQAQ